MKPLLCCFLLTDSSVIVGIQGFHVETNILNSWAWVYDEVYEKSFGNFYTNLTKQTLSVVDGLLAPGSSILDVGAGTGRLAIPLSERGYSITAIDASNYMLDVLRSKDPASRIHTVHSRLQELALKDQFDFVCCVFSVFCYMMLK